ncbi:hypothetical protein ACHADS_09025 [Bacillus vallismortis]|uniref:hypothetical protein n=1 Tax=Bacillus vallismortis TaxID=72361 RepID=UPI00374CF579
MKSHIDRILHSKKSIIIFFIITIIPLIDAAQIYITEQQYGVKYHPAFAFFLAGMTRGHAMQIILLWFLPIFLLILFADDGIQDSETGYRKILISKMGKKSYLVEKMTTAFIVSSMTIFISLVINFAVVNILFNGGTYNNGLSDIDIPQNLLYTQSMANPFVTDIIYIFIASFISGLCGIMCASVCFFFREKKYAYTAAFFIWFLLVLKKNSLMFLFQPFTEYGYVVVLPILSLVILVFVMVPFILFIYEVKYNED